MPMVSVQPRYSGNPPNSAMYRACHWWRSSASVGKPAMRAAMKADSSGEISTRTAVHLQYNREFRAGSATPRRQAGDALCQCLTRILVGLVAVSRLQVGEQTNRQ